jgi:hypothetical protein
LRPTFFVLKIAPAAHVFVASATQYQIELSRDSGATWSAAATNHRPDISISGLAREEKIHVRAIALNTEQESTPGPEYPIYATGNPPLPPDGLHVALRDCAAQLTWGEVLGVTEYRIYARIPSEHDSRLIYRGLDRSFTHKHEQIRSSLEKPNSVPAVPGKWIEYTVTAVNGNGESTHSRIADTDPGSWRNWDPMPGEPFRRTFEDTAASASIKVLTTWPRYYPQ